MEMSQDELEAAAALQGLARSSTEHTCHYPAPSFAGMAGVNCGGRVIFTHYTYDGQVSIEIWQCLKCGLETMERAGA